MRNLILAIDQGSSGTKTVVFDIQGRIKALAAESLETLYPRPGFVEQDPEALIKNVRSSVRACVGRLREAGGNPEDIAACGLTNQRETFLLWDGGGRPLSNAVSWQCARSAGICRRLREAGQEDDVEARTGLIINPYFSGTKLLWLMENDPGVAAAVRNGQAFFGTVDSWLLYRLSGGSVHATDLTNASRTLLFNLDSLSWDGVLLARWGLEGLRLPAVHPSQHPFTESDFDGALPRAVPILSVIGDSHAAAFGEGCFSPGDTKATVGTGSSILMSVGAGRPAARDGMISTICWSLPDRVERALEGIIVSAGATVSWIRDQLGLLEGSGDSEAAARSVEGNGGVYLIPAFSGLGAPHWRMEERARITGLTFASTRAHVVRAALESVAYQITDVLEAMRASSGMRTTELRVDGGITANGFVMQLCADLLDVPVVNRGIAEVSALGAATMAGIGAGLYSGIEEVSRLPRKEQRYNPGPGRAQALADWEGWKQALG